MKKHKYILLASIIAVGIMAFFFSCEKEVNNPKPTENATVMDIDGNTYLTVKIGEQWWMAENLRVTRYGNEDSIITGLVDTLWRDTTAGSFSVYPFDMVDGIDSTDAMVEAYGILYNWFAVTDIRGLCPTGWHVPSNNEWTELTEYIGGTFSPLGNELKSCRQVESPAGDSCATAQHPRWDMHATEFGTNYYEFSAFPGGYRSADGTFKNILKYGFWWSSTKFSSSNAHVRYLFNANGVVGTGNYDQNYGFSVRCVKD